MAAGRLRVYLGAAPGAGKTYSMLAEAVRRHERGTRVVVAGVDAHGLPRTEELLAALDLVTPADLDPVLDLGPEVVGVDDLARHLDLVLALLDRGVDVISTVNVFELASLADVGATILGGPPVAEVPDSVLYAAEQVELVDITPEAWERRRAHGNVDADRPPGLDADALAALRELALRWVAEWAHRRVPLDREPAEVVAVAITGAPGNGDLIRRAARMAQRRHAQLVGVHVRTSRAVAESPALASLRDLLLAVGAEYHEVYGDDPADALLAFAAEAGATQLVIGEGAGSVWQQLRDGSIVNDVLQRAGRIDVHVVGPGAGGTRSLGRTRAAAVTGSLLPQGGRPSPLSGRRRVAGYVVGLAGVPLVTVADLVVAGPDTIDSAAPVLLLAVVTAAAMLGGRRPAILSALVASLSTSYFFTAPRYQLAFATASDVLDGLVFVLVALAVGTVVSRLAEREDVARRARADAELLARVAAGVPSDRAALMDLLADLRLALDLAGLAVLVAEGDDSWSTVAAAGAAAPTRPGDGLSVPLDANAVLVASGEIAAERRPVLFAVAQQLAGDLERRRLAEEATQVTVAAETERLRTAILRAVSHDFRTPLASIKAASSSLLEPDVDWPPEVRDRFVRTIDDKADHLDRMVANLLDLSRLEAGGIEQRLRPVGFDEVLPHVLAGVDLPASGRLHLGALDELPPVTADPTMLERVLANIVGNALDHTPPGSDVQLEGTAVGGRVLLRVVDHGPGIPATRRSDVLLPFHRLDDGGGGAGLGLAVANGFVDAMGGELQLTDTPGGGLTVTVVLPAAA